MKRPKKQTSPKGIACRVKAWWEAPEKEMDAKPLMDHLKALRQTIMICALAVVAGFLLVFLGFSQQLVGYITDPVKQRGIQMIFIDLSEAFKAQTKLSVIVGVVIASPIVAGVLWRFISPALKRKERVICAIVFSIAVILFALGVYFAYRFVFFLAVNFFINAGQAMASPMLSLGTYVDFLFAFLLPFGFMFELPVVVVWLTKMGFVTTSDLKKMRRYVILGIFVIAAILTPPDVVSQVMLGLPMVALYEVGVLASWVTESPGRLKKLMIKREKCAR